jgi:beta-lactamase regulating signal transducer with metallopeptidase domain
MNSSPETPPWIFWALCCWITGVAICLVYTLTGRIGVKHVCRKISPHGNEDLKIHISSIAREMGIARKIEVVVSSRCRIPFTYRCIHPVLVIPTEAKDWPKSKLENILIHELAHIRRHDCVVLFLIRLLCSFFWYIPVMWIGLTHLQIEQEKICDSVAVQNGKQPFAYARHMIELARSARGLVLWSGIFIMKRKKKMLEKRISNVLEAKGSPVHEREPKRTARPLASFLILVFAVTIIAGINAGKQNTTAVPEALLYGTWVNQEYNMDGTRWPKMVFKSDGTWTTFGHTEITEGLYGTFKIVDSWMDSAGNRYYKAEAFSLYSGGKHFHDLYRLNEAGNVFEKLWSMAEYPTKIDPDHARYTIHYRL